MNIFEETPAIAIGASRKKTDVVHGDFRAVVLKRPFLGRVTFEEFVFFAKRFVQICRHIYPDITLNLRRNKQIWLAPRMGQRGGDPGESVELEDRKVWHIANKMIGAQTMVLIIKNPSNVFVMIEWINLRPRMLFFYCQESGDSTYPLTHALAEHMFHTEDTAPNLTFNVKIGFDEVYRAREGKW